MSGTTPFWARNRAMISIEFPCDNGGTAARRRDFPEHLRAFGADCHRDGEHDDAKAEARGFSGLLLMTHTRALVFNPVRARTDTSR